MSDHRWITYDLGSTKVKGRLVRDPRKTDINAFRVHLSGELHNLPIICPRNVEALENYSTTIINALTFSYKKACQLRKVTESGRATPWWCPELGHLRELTKKACWLTASNVSSRSRIRWAIRSFAPFKSPGPDGISPALLQWGLDLI